MPIRGWRAFVCAGCCSLSVRGPPLVLPLSIPPQHPLNPTSNCSIPVPSASHSFDLVPSSQPVPPLRPIPPLDPSTRLLSHAPILEQYPFNNQCCNHRHDAPWCPLFLCPCFTKLSLRSTQCRQMRSCYCEHFQLNRRGKQSRGAALWQFGMKGEGQRRVRGPSRAHVDGSI